MTLREFIDSASKIAGDQKRLAEKLGVVPQDLTGAKAGRRGLPNDACVKLAQITGADPLEVIAASELATEKKPEKRAFWESYQARAACMAIALTALNVATPSPAEANNHGKELMTLFLLC